MAFHEIVRDQANYINLLNTDAELNRIVYGALEDFDSLALEEKRRFETFFISNLRMWENLLHEVEEGRDPRSLLHLQHSSP